MSIFFIPSSVEGEIERAMNSFWWSNGSVHSKCIKWLSWDRLAMKKKKEIMSLKNLYTFNISLLGKYV